MGLVSRIIGVGLVEGFACFDSVGDLTELVVGVFVVDLIFLGGGDAGPDFHLPGQGVLAVVCVGQVFEG